MCASTEMMNMWLVILNCIRIPAPRFRKAEQIQELALIFVKKFIDFRCSELVTPYMHMLAKHVPDQIRHCPVEIIKASGSAIETQNQMMKRVLL